MSTSSSSRVLLGRLPLLFCRRRLSTAAAAAAAPASASASASEGEGKKEEEVGGGGGVISMKGVRISGRPLYLDMQATTPVDPRVLDAMLPFYLSRFGNPHSRTHLYGWESDAAVEAARAQVPPSSRATPGGVLHSGATESNNISVKGLMRFHRDRKRHVVTTRDGSTSACSTPAAGSSRRASRSPTCPSPDGSSTWTPSPPPSARHGLVSVMAVNNEIGVVQPLEDIGCICRTSASPSTPTRPGPRQDSIDVGRMGVALMSLSGHKIYGPRASAPSTPPPPASASSPR
ncbi:Cysteine desulfurase, mitochondrial [Ananas comosus]|uniref:Cysteine desulfurase, mitochondrial n=1 Tax=Ananas comosus TaxID=4615 RepID=A0A199V7H7_ANACO|nr:Cysteine desulfurase, mitochondrial [Ananas comosus]